MKFILSLTSFALIIVVINAKSNDSPLVYLPGLGTLQGTTLRTAWTRRQVFHFIDVKYAESPGGHRRFKPPVPVHPWKGVRDAYEDGLGCPSVLSLDEYAVHPPTEDLEDCLTMSISSPDLSASHPVMVYIHGEYLYEGNNLEGSPKYLLEKDVVLVVPQYRLAPFGFLSTMTNEIAGNAGVFDIVLALHWVQRFISYFGGDPNRVTLFGQVGGAAIAHLLTFSPIVPKNIFHQVIYQSGAATTPIFLTENPLKFARDIGERSGCNKNTTVDQLNDCLMSISTLRLLQGFKEHAQELAVTGIGNYGGMQFTIGGPSHLLPENPSNILLQDRNYSIPTMGGVPKNAGSRAIKEIFDVDFHGHAPDEIFRGEDYINHIIYQTMGMDEKGVLTNFLTKDLFSYEALRNGTFKAMIPGLIDLAGTVIHKSSVLFALKRNAKYLPRNTFLYSFDYKGSYNRYPDFDDDFDIATPFRAGVSLTDENIYLFPYPDHVEKLNPLDTEMARKMVELWTSFATNGIPSIPRFGRWPPMTNTNGPYLKIDEVFSIGYDYFDEFSATVRDEAIGISLVRDHY